MYVMLDTNIYISALLFPESLPALVLRDIIWKHKLVLCEHVVKEIKEVISRKRPDLLKNIDAFFAQLSYEMAGAPEYSSKVISDPKDQPILNAAIQYNVDIIISGDKHFLKLDLEKPKIMSVADYWHEVTNE